MSTAGGLSRFDPRTKTFTNFYESDGLAGSAFEGYPAASKSRRGQMFFGSKSGLTSFWPEQIVENPYTPPVVLTQFSLRNVPVAPGPRAVLAKSITSTPSLTLSHDQNLFSFDFAALSYVDPQRNQYRYMLEPLDDSWNRVDANRRMATFTTLPAGSYTLRIQGSNNRSVWNDQGVTLRLEILPAWWGTTWFRVLSVGAVLSLLGAAYQLRIRQLRHEERKLQEVVDSIPAIAGIARPDGSNEYLNRRWVEFTALPAVGAAGAGWHVAVHPDDKDRYVAKWDASLLRGEPFEVEARFRSALGEYRWFLVRAVPVRDKRGNICNWYGVMTDIEDRMNAERELEKLSGRLIHAQEEERSRIARELHDDISQSLGLLAIKIDQLRADPATPSQIGTVLERLKDDTSEVAADVHRLSHQLHSSTLDYVGLVPAVKKLVEDFSNRHGISVAFAGESLSSTPPPDVALCLFRIVQESLNNVAKHSQARSARVRVTGTAEGVHLTIEDDGIGFKLAHLETYAGLGFISMRERLRPLHGSVRVDSTPGRGTRIDVYVPVTPTGASDTSAQVPAQFGDSHTFNN